jgi:hypothetical protein
MKPRSRVKTVGRKQSGSFLALPHRVLESANYLELSSKAVKLLIDICMQFRGANNGDLSTTWRLMKARGWRSRETLDTARDELLDAGMIEQTRQGGMHKCNLYAFTWQPIDECGGKLHVNPTKVASGLWAKSREFIAANTPIVLNARKSTRQAGQLPPT